MPPPVATSTIVQQAFRLMEVSPPSSFDDGSEKALAAEDQYPEALRACLEFADWSFASVLARLSAVTTLPDGVAADPSLPWLYELPGDVLRLREVGMPWPVRWRRDRAGLRADAAGPLTVRYTAAAEDEAGLPADFRDAVAWRLAVMLAPKFLETQAKIEALKRDAERAIKAAARTDAGQASAGRYDDQDEQGDWVAEARYG